MVGPVIAGLAYPYLHNTGQFLVAAAMAVAMAAWTAALRQPTPVESAPGARQEAALESG